MLKRRRPQYTREEVTRRGRALYQRRVRRKVSGEKKGRVVALDIETADFEVADDALSAATQLLERRPDAQVWVTRIGYRALHRIAAGRDWGTAE